MKLICTIDGTQRTPLMEGSSINLRRPVSSARIVLDDVLGTTPPPAMLDPVTVKINNDVLYSEDFGKAVWLKSEATIAADSTLDPIWGLRATQKLVESGATAQHFVYQRYLGDTNSENVVWSAYLKSAGRTTARLVILQRDWATTHWVDVDLTDGSITDDGGSTSSNSEDVGGGWYRVAVIGNTGTGSNDAQGYIQLQDGTSYAGDGSSGILVWGAQWQSAQSSLDQYNPTLANSTIFDGFSIAHKLSPVGQASSRLIEIDCVDWTWRLSNPPAVVTKVYQNQTDRAIILDALAESDLDSDITASSATIAEVETGLTIAFDGATMRDVLDEMNRASGGQSWIENRTLYYSDEPSVEYAKWFANTDDPTNPATWDVENLVVTKRQDFPLNSVEVVGPTFEGVTPSGTATDATSISAIGTYHKKIEVKTATTDGYAGKVATQLVAAGKDAREAVSFRFSDDFGRLPLTSLGRLMFVKSSRVGLPTSQGFLIREIAIKQSHSPVSDFTITAGDFRPSVTDILSRLDAAAKTTTALPYTIGALDFTAASSESVTSSSTSLTAIDLTTDFSILATVRVDTIAAARTICALDDSSNLGFTLEVTAAGLIQLTRTRASANYQYSRLFPGGGFVAGTVYRIVCTSDTTLGARFWINGVEATTGGGSNIGSGAFDAASTAPFYVGRDNGGAYMDGVIGGVAVWSVTLPETTASGLHNSRFTALPFPNQVDLAWALDEFAEGNNALGTDAILDRSVNGYNGTPQNTPVGAELVYIAS